MRMAVVVGVVVVTVATTQQEAIAILYYKRSAVWLSRQSYNLNGGYINMEQIEIRMPEYIQQNAQTKIRPVKKVEIEIPAYSQQYGVWSILEERYLFDVQIERDNTIVITADKGGLISFARHLLTLSQDEVPVGCHVHYDENILEDGSHELIVCKI